MARQRLLSGGAQREAELGELLAQEQERNLALEEQGLQVKNTQGSLRCIPEVNPCCSSCRDLGLQALSERISGKASVLGVGGRPSASARLTAHASPRRSVARQSAGATSEAAELGDAAALRNSELTIDALQKQLHKATDELLRAKRANAERAGKRTADGARAELENAQLRGKIKVQDKELQSLRRYALMMEQGEEEQAPSLDSPLCSAPRTPTHGVGPGAGAAATPRSARQNQASSALIRQLAELNTELATLDGKYEAARAAAAGWEGQVRTMLLVVLLLVLLAAMRLVLVLTRSLSLCLS